VPLTVTTTTTPDDIARCQAIRRVVFTLGQGVPVSIEVDGRDPDCTHFLAIQAGVDVGAARMRIVGDAAKAERVAVLSTQRGGGIGRALMDALESRAVADGLARVKLSAQSDVVVFYERLGYTASGEEFIEADIPHRWMEKSL
jgi:predicted GNAT family N-acyltransferase